MRKRMDLSKFERLIISNQFKILEKLYPEEAEYYSKHRKALENGYKLHYQWIVENLYDEMSEEECQEVIDILSMYRSLTYSYQKLEDKSGIEESDIRFPGFDGNNETNQYSYTNYFIIELDRFKELTGGSEYADFNSHCPMLDLYRRMLSKWKNLKDRNNLTEDEIISIVKG